MKYTIIKKLGNGAFSSVFLVKLKYNNKLCALKRLSKNNDTLRLSFKNEISLLTKLNHPNIVPIINYFETKNFCNIILPYAKYGTLETLIEKKLNKSVKFMDDDIKKIILEMSKGIDYLHKNKIIHCDIKPSNILLFGNKIIKICDFGVSRDFKNSKYQTAIGTPYYIAPEIVNNEGYNHNIDYWSLGVISYELITLKKPFTGSGYYHLILKIVKNKYNKKIIPKKYLVLIENLLHNQPELRYNHINIVSFFSKLIILPLIYK